jgi:hypothetical protein
MNRLLRNCLFVLAAGSLAAPSVLAQTVTTGAISGTITDDSGGVLPGATVEAVHDPTGTPAATAATTS